jgi:hypothetical protein
LGLFWRAKSKGFTLLIKVSHGRFIIHAIIKVKAMTGIFYVLCDSKTDLSLGGDYDVLGQNFGNKANY